MSSKTSRKKKLREKELKVQNRKELLNELLPLGKSFALWIVLVVIVAADYTNKQWFSMFFVDYTTYMSYGLAKLLFIQADILGTGSSMVTMLEVNYQSITICNFPMIVELECSAYHAYLAMISLVAFSWWSVKQKLIIGSILFAILSFINALRIVLLGVIGKNFPNLFNMMHDYIWNILLVIIIWGMWEIVNRKLSPIQN
ncbi:MAG: exosortase/archaeosortase family protein [Prolixibacteraceae bacterium]|jgi:exosortase/archaeosortase family protein|nr:exosortase/archaeosortase family protein [Prolixibacteraceae bacterium]